MKVNMMVQRLFAVLLIVVFAGSVGAKELVVTSARELKGVYFVTAFCYIGSW